MTGQKWMSSKYKGVRFYQHPIRKHGVKFDRYIAIRYQKDGKRVEEGLGWTSERDPSDGMYWTEEKAALLLDRLRGAARQGIDAPTRIAEQREKLKAAAAEAEQARQKENTRKEAEQKYTLKELLKTYITHLKTQGKDKTAKAMESCVKCHLLDADQKLADKPAARVTSIELAGLIRKVKEKGHDRTAGILRSTLAAAYNCARRSPFDASLPSEFISFQISTNPIEPIPAIPVNAGKRVLTEDEIKTFIMALGDSPLDLSIKLAMYSGGQRMAQLLRAEVIHWDAQNRTLLLYDSKGKRRNAREHLLPLQETAAGIVAGIMERQPGKWIFSNDGGKTPIHEANTGKRISQIVADKKMTDFDYRDIRRTCETMLASLGVSKDTRSQLLSHGISGVQAVHYDRHDYLNEKRAALAKWEHHLIEIISGVERKVINFPT
jgi:integrase